MKIRLELTYPHPRAKIWRALTDPVLVARWFMRPDGLEPKVGTRFTLYDREVPAKHWRGFVECRVLEVEAGARLSHTWVGHARDASSPQVVSYRLEDAPGGGTRLRFEHDGFRGFGGLVLSRFVLGPGWKKHLGESLGRVAAEA